MAARMQGPAGNLGSGSPAAGPGPELSQRAQDGPAGRGGDTSYAGPALVPRRVTEQDRNSH